MYRESKEIKDGYDPKSEQRCRLLEVILAKTQSLDIIILAGNILQACPEKQKEQKALEMRRIIQKLETEEEMQAALKKIR